MAGGELEREAGTLAETEDEDLLLRHRLQLALHHEAPYHGHRRGDARLVLLDGYEKAVRVPAAPFGLRREEREVLVVELGGERDDVRGTGAATVDHDHRRRRERNLGPLAQQRLSFV